MKKIKIVFGALSLAALFLAGCVKKVEPISYALEVNYKSSNPKNVTGDVTLNAKDSIYLDFDVTSQSDMKFIEIQKNGTKIDTMNILPGSSRSFSGIKKYRVDSIPGTYTYRVLARNAAGTFMGDGGKAIKVTINNNFDYWTMRKMLVQDSAGKANASYFSATTGEVFSYLSGASKSGMIDFAYYYDSTTVATGATAFPHTIYALNATNGFNHFDLSGWTKNATVFKRVTTPTFASLTSAGALRSAGIANLASGTSSKITLVKAGDVILFKTAAGKYGAISINFVDALTSEKPKFINVDVKIER